MCFSGAVGCLIGHIHGFHVSMEHPFCFASFFASCDRKHGGYIARSVFADGPPLEEPPDRAVATHEGSDAWYRTGTQQSSATSKYIYLTRSVLWQEQSTRRTQHETNVKMQGGSPNKYVSYSQQSVPTCTKLNMWIGKSLFYQVSVRS